MLSVAEQAYQLAPWNHQDWRDIQPQSGIEGCSECQLMDESSLAA